MDSEWEWKKRGQKEAQGLGEVYSIRHNGVNLSAILAPDDSDGLGGNFPIVIAPRVTRIIRRK